MNYKITVKSIRKDGLAAYLITLELWGDPPVWGSRMERSVTYMNHDMIVRGGHGISLSRKSVAQRYHKMEVTRFNLILAATVINRLQGVIGKQSDIDQVTRQLREGKKRCNIE